MADYVTMFKGVLALGGIPTPGQPLCNMLNFTLPGCPNTYCMSYYNQTSMPSYCVSVFGPGDCQLGNAAAFGSGSTPEAAFTAAVK